MIDTEDFELWKEHKVTKELYTRLQQSQLEIIEQLQDEGKYTTEGLLVLKRLCGIKEVLDQILTLTAGDFVNEDSSPRV